MGAQAIQQLLAPVVMISACGLLCMAMYNRLTAIVSRIRQFNRERMEDLLRSRGAGETVRRTLQSHREGLDTQVPELLERARLIHRALMCFMGTIAFMVLCSLTIGLSMVFPPAQWAAFALFVVGLLTMLAGILVELKELRHSLRQVAFEHKLVDRIVRGAPEGDAASE